MKRLNEFTSAGRLTITCINPGIELICRLAGYAVMDTQERRKKWKNTN